MSPNSPKQKNRTQPCLQILSGVAAILLIAGESVQANELPAPYVSRAIDAVVLPMTEDVSATFDVPFTDGVFVLATQPNGVADLAGILPGDIVQGVGNLNVYAPVQLDEAVYSLLKQGGTNFDIYGFRSGEVYSSATVLTIESWEETISIVEVSSWESYSYSEFSYEEFYSEHVTEMEASYSETLESIDESASSDEFDQQVTNEDLASEAEAMAEGSVDCLGEIIDGECVEGTSDQDMASEDDFVAEEEMPAEDDADYGDDSGDDGGDSGGGDEEFIE